MEEEKKWILYWRNSLADGDRLQVDLEKAIAKAEYDLSCLSEGKLPDNLAKAFFEAKEKELNQKLKKRKKEDKIKLHSIDIALSPFHILPKVEHGLHLRPGKELAVVYPFWIPAILSRSEGLLPPEYPYPRVIRSVLEPIITEGSSLTISTVERVDEALAEGSWDYPSWAAYWSYCKKFFKDITGQVLHNYQLPGYAVQHSGIVITDDQVRGASHNIIRLYDELRQRTKLPPLISNFIRCGENQKRGILSDEEQQAFEKSHLGHMNQAFALSPSQRSGLKHLKALKRGDILAINGPPGTGKTTLLQTVVANLFVEKAIEGRHPPIIAATSTNNQAVTNIIDSFAQAKSSHQHLANRWLPEIDSYAIYLPASKKRVAEEISFTKIKGGGLPEKIEHKDFWNEAKTYFLEQCQIYTQEKFDTPLEASKWLRHELLNQQSHIEDVLLTSELPHFIKEKLHAYSPHANSRLFIEVLLNTGKLERDIKLIYSLIETLNNFFELYKQFTSKHFQILANHAIWQRIYYLCPFRVPATLKKFSQNNIIPTSTLISFRNLLLIKLEILKDIKLGALTYRNWQEDASYYECILQTDKYLDTGPRHRAFLLATHYWEARWLMDIEPLFEGDLLRRNGKGAMERRWRRYAMLTPCFVSTFYMLPRFFQFTFYNEGYENAPMLDFIDLLIVDEAGQVSPEVAGASFSLAKQALIIGDIYQIQPIWKIPRHIDFANIERFKLIKDDTDIPTFNQYFKKGMLASSGSVMRMGLNTSAFNLPDRAEGGLFLTEHRRCYDEIISYCNQLAYRGALIPLRGSSPRMILPAFGFHHIPSTSTTSGGSRLNMEEVIKIVRWLNQRKGIIEQFYKDDYQRIEDIVGILTPFAAQGRMLRQVLKEYQFDIRKMKVGTVHSMQGAERPIIIFSSVYGGNNLGMQYFFDINIHMLNVAVSRAKDSFLLFGDTRIFNPLSGTPSGLLATYLQKAPSNNLEIWEQEKVNI